MAQAFCRALAWAVLGGLAIAPGLLWALPTGRAVAVIPWLGVAVLAGAALWTFRQRPTLAAVAAEVDRRAGTRDRLGAALAFAGSDDPLRRAAVAECERALAGFDLGGSLPWRVPRAVPWMAIPLACIAWLAFFGAGGGPVGGGAADAATLAVADRLESLAARVSREETSEALAEALRKSAHHLRTEAVGPDARREMLRELSTLEELARAAQGESPMDAMSEAFSGEEGELGEAVRRNDPQAAARALENRGTASGAMDDEALRQALERLARKQSGGASSPLGEAASRALEAMKQGNPSAATEAMRQMAQALREGAGQKQGKNVMQALEEMKNGGVPAMGEPQPGEEGGDSRQGSGIAMVEATGGNPEPRGATGASASEGSTPGGNPGTEHDEGSKASPFGDATQPAGHEPMQTRLHGLLGEGETLQSLIPTRTEDPKATAAYQAIYRAAAPAAEEALESEAIPLGSRFLIRRYFEAIRP